MQGIQVQKRLIFPNLPAPKGLTVRVTTESGREIVGGFLFNWDQVTEKVAKIEIEHPSHFFEYGPATFHMMFNETVDAINGGRSYRALNVGLFDGINPPRGHKFLENGDVYELFFDLSKFTPATIDAIMKG